MTKELTPERISNALFQTDPMHTCCKENDCFDEYDRVALGAAEKLSQGYALEAALRSELAEWFGHDMAETAKLKATVSLLNMGGN